jgi:uncharacterized protein (DUF169 family)
MPDWMSLEKRLSTVLALRRRPVAVAFRDEPPAQVASFAGSEPSGCSFWRLAAEGRTFYTVPRDHLNCPIGSFTHNVPLPAERSAELDEVLGLMTRIGYLRMEEVPRIARLQKTPGAIIFAPLGEAPLPPDVVLLAGRPGRLMLLHEAAIRAQAAAQVSLLGRPTCMALPAALAAGAVLSTGCVGNRVYTDLGEDELYVAVPGKDLARIAQELDTIEAANAQLARYHDGRRRQLSTA